MHWLHTFRSLLDIYQQTAVKADKKKDTWTATTYTQPSQPWHRRRWSCFPGMHQEHPAKVNLDLWHWDLRTAHKGHQHPSPASPWICCQRIWVPKTHVLVPLAKKEKQHKLQAVWKGATYFNQGRQLPPYIPTCPWRDSAKPRKRSPRLKRSGCASAWPQPLDPSETAGFGAPAFAPKSWILLLASSKDLRSTQKMCLACADRHLR